MLFCKIKPHIICICSPDKIDFIKLLFETIDKNGKIDYCATLIVNTFKNQKIDIKVSDKIEVLYSETNYWNHPPERWFVKPKSDICMFLDFDILNLNDINPLLYLCKRKNSLCGVLAYNFNVEYKLIKSVFDQCGVIFSPKKKTWRDNNLIPSYYNYGVLCMPSEIMLKISNVIYKNVNIVNNIAFRENDNYLKRHGGQIALSISIEELNIKTFDLPLRYNFPNTFYDLEENYPLEKEKIVFKHFLIKDKDTVLKERINRLSYF
jgi:hypothetical protein